LRYGINHAPTFYMAQQERTCATDSARYQRLDPFALQDHPI
jgi:hypothetical protein